MYRFLLSRRWLGLLAVSLLLAATCGQLGRWQLHRLDARNRVNAVITGNATGAPGAVDRLLAPGKPVADEDEYTRVSATGRYDRSHRLLVRNRTYDGQVGFYVLVPLVTASGTALLVNRGWVDAGESTAELPDVPGAPTGEVSVVARVRPAEPAGGGGGRGQVSRIDVPAIARGLPYAVYGGYADLVRERPAPRQAPTLLPAPETSQGPHLAYAFQWFLFALMSLGGYLVLARREAEDLRTGPSGRADGQQRSGPTGVVSVRIPG